jgi:soluble lytic murein transglycosylase-like protein
MVSVFKKIFGGGAEKTDDTGKSDKKSGSSFRDMLDGHLKTIRGEGAVVDSRIGMTSDQLKSEAIREQQKPEQKAENDADFDEVDTKAEMETNQNNLEQFLDKDPVYGKALKGKTLSDSYSSRVSSSLGDRLGKFKHLIEAKAKKYNLDPNLLAGLIRQESNYNPYAVSWCGAMGLGQLMPETARSLGVKDPFNAAQNLDGAAKYLRQQLDTFGGNTTKALAAYNAGPGAVMKYGGVPPYSETQNYVKVIQSHRTQIEKLSVFEPAKKKTELG